MNGTGVAYGAGAGTRTGVAAGTGAGTEERVAEAVTDVTLFIWGEDKDIVQVNKHFLRLMKTQSQTHWMYPQNPINTRLKRVVETMLSGKKCLEATVVHLIKMPEMMYNPNLRFIAKLR